MAILKEMLLNQWVINDGVENPLCVFCHFNADCSVCADIRDIDANLHKTQVVYHYMKIEIFDRIRNRKKLMVLSKKVILDNVNIILNKGDKNGKKKKKK